ncbi:MAG: hypothetical protein E6I32_13555 [Chloroflexi bacterium]|nr:MAG: hypothetical protein E6I32_13555 [Chloroflexota bacterium]
MPKRSHSSSKRPSARGWRAWWSKSRTVPTKQGREISIGSAGALQDTIDCVLLGYIFGRGKRAALGAGALLVGVYDPKQDMFVTVSKIGTGLTDEEWRSIRERTKGLVVDHKPARVFSLIEPSVWLEPKIVVEVLADEITRSPIHTAGKVGDEPGYVFGR